MYWGLKRLRLRPRFLKDLRPDRVLRLIINKCLGFDK